MKTKIYRIVLIILCICFICGCEKKLQTEKKEELTHEDLILKTDYTKIDNFMNSLFNELDFDGEMELLTFEELNYYFEVTYTNQDVDTFFDFYFDKNEEFGYVDVRYNEDSDDSIKLTQKLFKYSEFKFSLDDIDVIDNIIEFALSYEEKEIGDFILSNSSTGDLTFRLKGANIEKQEEQIESSDDNSVEDNSHLNDEPNNNLSSNNSTNSIVNSNNNSNSNGSTNSNTNSNDNASSNNKPNNNSSSQSSNNNNSVSVSKKNALNRAKSYLSSMAFSRDGLVKQLEYEGFSNSDAIYGVDNSGADWNVQAIKKAKSYLSSMAFSYKGLIKQLEYEKFTNAQAKYGVDNSGANWNEQAVKKAKNYLSTMAFSYNGLVKQLEYEGFTNSEAIHGVNNSGADWNEQAVKKAKSYLSIMSFSREGLITQLKYEGFTQEQAEYGASRNGL